MFKFDQNTGKIFYLDQEIGEHINEDGVSTVHLDFRYSAGDDWMVPLSWLAHGLALLRPDAEATPNLVIETAESDINRNYDVPRFLIEKTIKRDGYKWQFYKSDADPWPSLIHGHDYEKALILDAITGDIFDAATRQKCKCLKAKHLQHVQAILSASSDFSALAKEYFVLIDNFKPKVNEKE